MIGGVIRHMLPHLSRVSHLHVITGPQGLGCNRYKLVCALYLGSLQSQGIAVTSRGLLDERFDSCDTACYLSPSSYVVASVYGVFSE